MAPPSDNRRVDALDDGLDASGSFEGRRDLRAVPVDPLDRRELSWSFRRWESLSRLEAVDCISLEEGPLDLFLDPAFLVTDIVPSIQCNLLPNKNIGFRRCDMVKPFFFAARLVSTCAYRER